MKHMILGEFFMNPVSAFTLLINAIGGRLAAFEEDAADNGVKNDKN